MDIAISIAYLNLQSMRNDLDDFATVNYFDLSVAPFGLTVGFGAILGGFTDREYGYMQNENNTQLLRFQFGYDGGHL